MAFENLPIQPPLEPMLSHLEPEIPRGPGWRYEPKWDGFRAIVFRDGDSLHIQSRDKRPLERFFPELPPLMKASLPDRCVVDGEVVIRTPQGLDFETLQMRLHPAASRIKKLSAETPASFICFDVIAIGGDDLRGIAFGIRRARLEEEIRATDRIVVTPQTTDPALAAEWLVGLEKQGFDGVVAKKEDQFYEPGARPMVKLKRRRSAEVVVGGYRLNKSKDGIGSLLLGMYDSAGVLQLVGHTSSFTAKERRALLTKLNVLEGAPSFGEGRTPGGPSRWSKDKDMSWTAVAPTLVAEVSYDHLQCEGGPSAADGDGRNYRFRHAARFERWREDKPPAQCTTDQLLAPARLDLSASSKGEDGS